MQLHVGRHRVLVVPDIQEPFSHPDSIHFIGAVKEQYGTDRTVFIGDEVDFHALSKFPHDPDGLAPGEELIQAIDSMAKWYKLFPTAKVCISNHTDRIFRRAFSAGIPKNFLKSYREFLQAPRGWEWADNFIIDNIKYEHGDNQGGVDAARQLAIANRMSTVIGHHHSHGGVRYMANDEDTIFGLNVGCLIDRHAYVFKYGKGAKFKPTLGCGIIIKGLPQFIPMVVGPDERWIGRLIV